MEVIKMQGTPISTTPIIEAPLLTDALFILPIAILFGTLIVLLWKRRKH